MKCMQCTAQQLARKGFCIHYTTRAQLEIQAGAADTLAFFTRPQLCPPTQTEMLYHECKYRCILPFISLKLCESSKALIGDVGI